MNLFADMGVQPATLQPELVPAQPSTDTEPPSCAVLSSTAIENGGGRWLVRGVAADAGGVVAAVEVSENGGLSWHPADAGLAEWEYISQPASLDYPAATAAAMLCRAVDDSGNMSL